MIVSCTLPLPLLPRPATSRLSPACYEGRDTKYSFGFPSPGFRIPWGLLCFQGSSLVFASSQPSSRPFHGKSNSLKGARGLDSLLLKRSIRQFEEVTHAGSLVVLGNVAPGATIKAEGDIIVLGRLSGKVHAGCAGNPEAVVIALKMEPSLIAIDNQVSAGPDSASSYPEIAFISSDGGICIEPFSTPFSQQDTSTETGPQDPVIAHLARQRNINVKWMKESPPNSRPKLRQRALAAAITGVYIALAGLLALAAPSSTFALVFKGEFLAKGWIRLLGVLAVAFGIYYCGAAYGDFVGEGLTWFYLSTVIGRIFVFLAFCTLVAVGELPPAILLLAIMNLAGALSMLFALQRA